MEMTSTTELIEHERFRPLKRVEYDRLASLGFFEGERVELLFGVVVEMAPNDPAHAESTDAVRAALARAVGDRARVVSQRPFAASETSEPEPDVFVVPSGRYWKEHPGRAFLVVEVARTSLRTDRGVKARLYGASAVDEYWIVAVDEGFVEVYRDAKDGWWPTKSTHHRGELIAMCAIPNVEIAVADLLPPIE
jgi:Uma2 family endonuclease